MPIQTPTPSGAEPAAAPGATLPPLADDTQPLGPVLHPLAWSEPLRWLALGWQDFRACPGIGLFFGGCFVVMGWLLLAAFEYAPAYTLALSAGFLLLGPFLCLGLYHASLELEAGRRPQLLTAMMAWNRRGSALAIFGFVLLVLEMLWGRSAMVVFAVSFDGMPDFQGSLTALLDPQNLGFIVTYVVVGGVFAGLIFAVSVVSMPMILHRQTDAISAGLTSMRLVLTQPGVMLLWGALITVLVGLALVPGFLGLLIVGPVVGHATWHAYRAAVADDEPDALPPTDTPPR